MTGVSVDDVLTYAADFERSYVAVVHGRIKLRVGQIVYVAFSRDETTMGFGFPKDDRPALVASDPERFLHARPVGHALQLGGDPARPARPRTRCTSSCSTRGAWWSRSSCSGSVFGGWA